MTDHDCITRAALEVLPGWINSFWKDEIEALTEDYSRAMDKYVGNPDSWKRYCEYDNGTMIPHGMGQFRYLEHVDWYKDYYHFPFVPLVNKAMLFFIRKMVRCIQDARVTDTAKYAGALSHLIGDSVAPPHLDNTGSLDSYCESIRMLFPPPKKLRGLKLHTVMESGYRPFSIKGYRPRLLGSTVETAAFSFTQACAHAYVESKGQIKTILEGIYSGNKSKEQKGKRTAGSAGSRCLADAYYTIFSLARGNIKKPVAMVGLHDKYPVMMTAFAPRPYLQLSFQTINVNWRNAANKYGRAQVPLSLHIDKGSERKFKKGIGCGAPFIIEYCFPKNSFNEFRCVVGQNSKLRIRHAIDFSAATDKGEVFRQTLHPGKNRGYPVRTKLDGARRLRLEFSGPGRGVGGDHLVVAEPAVHV